MCMPSTPKAPAPLPVVAPPALPILAPPEQSVTKAALAANRGRNSLRIDRTTSLPGSSGSGLNIPN